MNIKRLLNLVLAAAFLFSFTQCNDNQITEPESEFKTSFANAKAFLRSEQPTAQSFSGDAETGFTFTTEGNLKFTFSGYQFYNGGVAVTGNVDVEVTEYLNNADMIRSGITTAADDQLLQSGGMFNIEVSQGGQDLDFSGTYQVLIPTQSVDWSMQIFEGVEGTDENGDTEVNWVASRDSSWLGQTTIDTAYELNLTFLSWCNLDKYYNATDGASVHVKLPDGYTNANSRVLMIFDDNSVVSLMGDTDAEEFNSGNYNLPLGWDVQFLVISVNDDEELEYALISSTTADPHLETVTTLTKITEDDLNDLIDSL